MTRMRAMYYLMAFVAAAMAGWCFADADYVLAIIYALSAVLWFLAFRLSRENGQD